MSAVLCKLLPGAAASSSSATTNPASLFSSLTSQAANQATSSAPTPPPVGGEKDLAVLLQSLRPQLNDGEYVFVSVPNSEISQIPRSFSICEFKEKEGTTLILQKQKAEELSLLSLSLTYDPNSTFRWISLCVFSSLEAVGLTAAVSKFFTAANISCNVVAGYYHDHLFVPSSMAEKAMKVLSDLSSSTPASSTPTSSSSSSSSTPAPSSSSSTPTPSSSSSSSAPSPSPSPTPSPSPSASPSAAPSTSTATSSSPLGPSAS